MPFLRMPSFVKAFQAESHVPPVHPPHVEGSDLAGHLAEPAKHVADVGKDVGKEVAQNVEPPEDPEPPDTPDPHRLVDHDPFQAGIQPLGDPLGPITDPKILQLMAEHGAHSPVVATGVAPVADGPHWTVDPFTGVAVTADPIDLDTAADLADVTGAHVPDLDDAGLGDLV